MVECDICGRDANHIFLEPGEDPGEEIWMCRRDFIIKYVKEEQPLNTSEICRFVNNVKGSECPKGDYNHKTMNRKDCSNCDIDKTSIRWDLKKSGLYSYKMSFWDNPSNNGSLHQMTDVFRFYFSDLENFLQEIVFRGPGSV